MVCGMVKWKQWLGVKAGPWWCVSVSVKVSEVGAAACLLYSFSNVCRDFTICFPQNILAQGDIQMRDLKFHALAFMSLQFAAYGRFNCLAFQMCFLLLSHMTFTSH